MCVSIGNVKIKGKAILAPMAGITDRAYREICRNFGAAYVVSEMVSAKGIIYNNKNTLDLLTISEAERPCAIQLFGNDPYLMAEAAKIVEDKFKPDIIDINMGCPAPKIVSNECGSAMMKKPKLCGEVTKAVKNAVKVPVTVKIRKGWDNETVNALQVAKICEESGADAIAVHGRTRAQMYSPCADWDIIKKVKETLKIPIIANGDVDSAVKAKEILNVTGCDLVMIGRGSLGNPWIFNQVNTFLDFGEIPTLPTIEEKLQVIKKHVDLMCKYKGERLGIKESRKIIAWYIKGIHNAASFRKKSFEINSLCDLNYLLNEIKECNNI